MLRLSGPSSSCKPVPLSPTLTWDPKNLPPLLWLSRCWCAALSSSSWPSPNWQSSLMVQVGLGIGAQKKNPEAPLQPLDFFFFLVPSWVSHLPWWGWLLLQMDCGGKERERNIHREKLVCWSPHTHLTRIGKGYFSVSKRGILQRQLPKMMSLRAHGKSGSSV